MANTNPLAPSLIAYTLGHWSSILSMLSQRLLHLPFPLLQLHSSPSTLSLSSFHLANMDAHLIICLLTHNTIIHKWSTSTHSHIHKIIRLLNPFSSTRMHDNYQLPSLPQNTNCLNWNGPPHIPRSWSTPTISKITSTPITHFSQRTYDSYYQLPWLCYCQPTRP